jgi:hypothetical protein
MGQHALNKLSNKICQKKIEKGAQPCVQNKYKIYTTTTTTLVNTTSGREGKQLYKHTSHSSYIKP